MTTLAELKANGLLREDCYIDGAWVAADNGARTPVHNPATGAVIAQIAGAGASETRRAIAAASAAFPAWAARTAADRALLLRRWFDLIIAHADDLGWLLTAEQGKPLAEGRGEIRYAASFIEWFAEEGKRMYGDVIPGHTTDKRIIVLRQPIGVVGAITPWNFPGSHDHAQVRPGAGRGLHLLSASPRAKPRCPHWRWRNWRIAPAFPPGCSTWSPARPA